MEIIYGAIELFFDLEVSYCQCGQGQGKDQRQAGGAAGGLSNEDLERFAWISSHDLQEPARMVSIYTGLLGSLYRDQLDENARQYIDFAIEGALRMSVLIKDLLKYSQINTQTLAPVPTDVPKVVGQVVANLQLLIDETSAQVISDPLPTVLADPAQLGQVFQNLIENALKYRKEDEPPKIHIRAERQNDRWLFSVQDNGIGIDPQYHEQVFVAFKRHHADRTKYPGSGIGLAIVKRIIERHGGRIHVTSTPGQGSTFYFTLPYHEPTKTKPNQHPNQNQTLNGFSTPIDIKTAPAYTVIRKTTHINQ